MYQPQYSKFQMVFKKFIKTNVFWFLL